MSDVKKPASFTSLTVWIIPFISVLICALLLRRLTDGTPLLPLRGVFSSWSTYMVAICVQAIPFLVLGVLISGLLAAFLPKDLLSKITPRSPLLAVPTACLAGVVLPGCECASVPVSQSLMRRGLPPTAALAFLLAAPAVNPVVIVATAVAFQNNPLMPWARLVASIVAVIFTCWIWVFAGKNTVMKSQSPHSHAGESKLTIFRETAINDLLQAGGFLVVGATFAATLKVALPTSVVRMFTAQPWLTILLMAALAILLALCSEADAFVVSSFTWASPTAQLVFLVIGPMVDIKLFAMQSGAFGTKFASRFMALTLAVCLLSALAIGYLLFGRI